MNAKHTYTQNKKSPKLSLSHASATMLLLRVKEGNRKKCQAPVCLLTDNESKRSQSQSNLVYLQTKHFNM